MSNSSRLPDYYTIREAAAILDRDVSQICRYVRAGLLPAVDLGHQWVIRQADVRKFTPPPRGNPNFLRDNAG